MATIFARQVFQPSCPEGGALVACGFGSRFVGCCVEASAACTNGCSVDDLKPASFVKDRYLDVTGSVCPGDSLWYTCQSTDPTFMGCCTSNPCQQNGCPSLDLRAAQLSRNEAEAAPYSALPDPSSRTTQTSPQTSTTSATVEPTSSAATTPSSPAAASRASIGVVIGATLGGLVLISFLTSLALLRWRRRRGRRYAPDISALPDNKDTPASSNQTSTSAFPSEAYLPHDSSPQAHELETPPLGPWHDVHEKAYEMPSPHLNNEETTAEGNKDGLGIYQAYRPQVMEGPGRYELSSEGVNVSHELHG